MIKNSVGELEQRELTSRVDKRVLRWFGLVERMGEYRMARRVLMVEVSGGRVWGRPKLGWMDGVKVAMDSRGMAGDDAYHCAKIGRNGELWCICR